jgi:hypothetical protein
MEESAKMVSNPTISNHMDSQAAHLLMVTMFV